MTILSTTQSDRVKISLGDVNLNGLTSFSLTAQNNVYKGSLLNLSSAPKSTFLNESLFSASLDKFLTSYHLTKITKDLIIGIEREDVSLMTDSYLDDTRGLVMENGWFDELSISVSSAQMPTCSWEVKSKNIRIQNSEDLSVSQKGDSVFLRPEMMNLKSSFEVFEYADSYSISISTKKTLMSSIFGKERIWRNNPSIDLNLSIPNSKKEDFLKLANFDSQNFEFEVFKDVERTSKIFGVKINDVHVDSMTENISESSSQSTNYSFSKIIRGTDFFF